MARMAGRKDVILIASYKSITFDVGKKKSEKGCQVDWQLLRSVGDSSYLFELSKSIRVLIRRSGRRHTSASAP